MIHNNDNSTNNKRARGLPRGHGGLAALGQGRHVVDAVPDPDVSPGNNNNNNNKY